MRSQQAPLTIFILLLGSLAAACPEEKSGGGTANSGGDAGGTSAGGMGSDAGLDGPDGASIAGPDAGLDADAGSPGSDAGRQPVAPKEERFGFVASSSDGLVRLWDMRVDGSGQRQIDMPGYAGITEAAWSGNGKKVAYTPFEAGFSNGFENLPIMIMNADGSSLEVGPSGRFPAWNYDGTVLAWVDYDLIEYADGDVTFGHVRANDYVKQQSFDLQPTPSGVVASGKVPFVTIQQLFVRSEPGLSVVGLLGISRPSPGPGMPGSLVYEIARFQTGSTSILATTDSTVIGIGLLGVNHLGEIYYAETRNTSEGARTRIRSGTQQSTESYSSVEGQIFSPNQNRTLQRSQGKVWIGTPWLEEQVPVTFGLPIRGVSSWFEVR